MILDVKKEITPYYLAKFQCTDLPFTYFEDYGGRGNFIHFLDTCRTDYIAYGCLSGSNWENYAVINDRYHWLIRHEKYFGGDFYLFSKKQPMAPLTEYYSEITNRFEPSLPEWGWVNDLRCIDSLTIEGQKSFASDEGEEFSPTFAAPLRGLIHSDYDIIDISADLRTPRVFPGAWIVVAVSSDGKDLKWSALPVNDFVQPGHLGRVYQTLRISDTDLRHHRMVFKAFIWNPVKSPYVLDNFRVRVRTGNPLIYGLFRKIEP